jgi:phenylacetate-CoA ligase
MAGKSLSMPGPHWQHGRPVAHGLSSPPHHPLHRLGSITTLPFRKELNRLEASRFWGHGDLQEQQEALLAGLLAHAFRNCRYFRERAGSRLGLDRQASRVLQELPLLTRNGLRKAKDCLTAPGRGSVFRRSSGGSTGEPAAVLLDAHYLRWNRAAKVAFDSWAGYRPGEGKVILWGARRDTRSPGLMSRVARLLRREVFLDAYDMGEARALEYLETIRRARPGLLLAYAETACELVRVALKHQVEPPGVGAVMTTGGTLYPDMREAVGGYFGAPVFTRYGAREVGDIACECPAHEGLHINPHTHYVELIKTDGSAAGPGESGEVAVTLLTNYAMPLIRYLIGDTATWAEKPCRCGLAWPLLKRVEGRRTDHFIATDGRCIHGGRFRTLLFDCAFVSRYQWIQLCTKKTRLRVVVDESYPAWRDNLEEVLWRARQELGKGAEVELSVEKEIKPGPTGKHRFTISLIKRS